MTSDPKRLGYFKRNPGKRTEQQIGYKLGNRSHPIQIEDQMEMTSETLQIMQDTQCLSSIAESRELSVTGAPQDANSAKNNSINSPNISGCGDDFDESPIQMLAKHSNSIPYSNEDTSAFTHHGEQTLEEAYVALPIV